MDKETFKAKMYHAEVMSEIDDSPDYWEGYKRGLKRAYHGEHFGTEAEHKLWLSLVDSVNSQDHERGRGYLNGLRVDTRNNHYRQG